YFQNDTNAEILMLYTSQLFNNKIDFKSEIIKIEDNYRNAGKVEDVFNRWNKITSQNGIFEEWVTPYCYANKLLTKKELKPLKESDSGFIFHGFLSILRKHSVSDKPNAFNKIFNLFLVKIYDEKKRDNDELDFQWKEKSDDAVEFQIRLINLYQQGMYEFLKKEVEGIHDKDFNYKTVEELQEIKKKWLKFNNVFTIKEVVDDESFDDNQRVLKEVVELLQKYQIRYPRRQQHLSNFFERLLTTGLKQESGQFFTPPPITKFVIKSLPIKHFIEKELNQPVPKLPAVIDYACGSGHFITEIMEQYQDIINTLNVSSYYPEAVDFVELSKIKQYDWAAKYVYGVEKDYRLVKVAKVGCYFYGDGLAQIMHGDGLDNFKSSKSYVGLLKENIDDSQKAKFSFVVSNPPYSVKAFKGDIKNDNVSKDFELYENLTDNSSEIECLFAERTKQLLKEGGAAAIILPSSILSNTGIYTKAREILFKYFEIIAIAELGSGTFMATGTNTVILFLRRRANDEWENIKSSVEKFFVNQKDVTVNGVENVFSKYVKHVWDKVNFEDYISLCQKKPNEKIKNHDIYKEYDKKIKGKNCEEKQEKILETEKEKLLYFILVCQQKIVLVKSGKKKEEKTFLGYEFSNRKGSEGMHPTQRGKSIEECTKLFDAEVFDNPEKASTYIYKAFQGDFDFPIVEDLQKNIFRHNLIDMLTFDRVDFEKTISLSSKKKIKIGSKWETVKIGQIASTQYGFTDKATDKGEIRYLRITDLNDDGSINLNNEAKFINPTKEIKKQFLLKNNDIVIARSGSVGKSAIYKSDNYPKMIFASYLIRLVADESKILPQYLFNFTKTEMYWDQVEVNSIAVTQPNLNAEKIKEFHIPLPPKNIQEKIINEIEKIEEKEKKTNEKAEELKNEINQILDITYLKTKTLEQLGNVSEIKNGGTPSSNNPELWNGNIPWATLVDTKEKYLTKTARHISEKGISKSGAVSLPINTVLFSSRATIGDVSIAKIEVCTNQGYKNFICNPEKLNYEYLFYILKREAKDIENLASGMTYPEISKTLISEYKIPIPSISGQQKIVAQIQKIEDQIFKLNEELQEIKNQKTAVLKKYL
ncbi:MAG: restriction endonuclease subunit S, partial [bacterium]